MRHLLFFLSFSTFALLTIGYMARRTLKLSPALAKHPVMVWGFLLGFVVCIATTRSMDFLFHHSFTWLHGITYSLFSVISTYFLYLLFFDVMQAIITYFAPTFTAPRRFALPLALGFTGISVLVGLFMAMRAPMLRQVDIPITHLPPDLKGFRIVQISDLHIAPLVSEESLHGLVKQVNALQPDLIAITGDLVDGPCDVLQQKAAILKTLSATHGTFFITGNHEYYSGVRPWLALFPQFGWHVLDNQCKVISQGKACIALVGLSDARPRFPTSLPPSDVSVVLRHRPVGYEEAERLGMALQLSGHTHSGQYFPWSLFVPLLFRYPKGLYRHGRLWLYTNPGTGFWGPPNRLFMPPELTLLTLRQAS